MVWRWDCWWITLKEMSMKPILVVAILLFIGGYFTVSALGYNYVGQDRFRLWLEKGKIITIVDIQVPAEFKRHHFKDAVETNAYPVESAADKRKLDRVLPKLSTNRDQVGIVCSRGGSSAKNTYDYLKSRGIDEKRLYILKDGMQGWPYQELVVAGK